jgi:hypothetical protein
MLLINVFVLPIALGGLLHFSGQGVDADTFVLTLPMAQRQEGLALLVFIGGLSAATGMVIVETIALSTMVCTDLGMPVLLRWRSVRLAEPRERSTGVGERTRPDVVGHHHQAQRRLQFRAARARVGAVGREAAGQRRQHSDEDRRCEPEVGIRCSRRRHERER